MIPQQVNDYDSYMYSLTAANRSPSTSPAWFKAYSFKEAFGLQDLSPASLDRLVNDMAASRALIRKYWEFKVKSGDLYLAQGCNDDCLKSHICEIVTNEFNDNRKCNELIAIFDTRAS